MKKKFKFIDKIIYDYSFKLKIIEFFKWKLVDIVRFFKYGKSFSEYGLTIYCGRQGGGKSISVVEYLERMRRKYTNVIIVTNFGYKYQNFAMNDWHDLLNIRNGLDGVIFAIDEIQNEFSSNAWKDFPEFLLNEITQQRKQRIKIVATSQVFTRVVKQLREQCFEVVECHTLFGRWTFQRCYDAEDYNSVLDSPEKKMKLLKKWRLSFVQTDKIRTLFNSYDKIERLKRTTFIPRHERGFSNIS